MSGAGRKEAAAYSPCASLRACLAFCLLALVACAADPEVDGIIDGATPPARPLVFGAKGPLTQRQSRVVLERLKRDNGSPDVLQKHLALEQALTSSPLIIGNEVRLLRDGPETFAAMFALIDSAKADLELEYFTFEDVAFENRHIVDVLVAKAAQGVRISILYDSMGSIATPAEVFDRLREAGVRLLEFNPFDPLVLRTPNYELNHRDHRKILVADGARAIVGGINVSRVYASQPFSRKIPAEAAAQDWRDTDMAIEGPAAVALRQLFLQSWEKQTGPPLALPEPAALPVSTGGEVVRVIGSTPDDALPRYYIALLSAIRNAEQRIWISAGYFVPTRQALEDLEAAARRGVDVRLLLPSKSDSSQALAAGRSRYEDLLDAGVKIYEASGVILHAKTAVIDGVWSGVGSSNFDRRSVVFNDEVDVVVLGRATASRLEAMFEEDCQSARRVDPAAWAERPFEERVVETIARLWEYWL